MNTPRSTAKARTFITDLSHRAPRPCAVLLWVVAALALFGSLAFVVVALMRSLDFGFSLVNVVLVGTSISALLGVRTLHTAARTLWAVR